MKSKKKALKKVQESEVVRIRLTGDSYAALRAIAENQMRTITNLAQMYMRQGIERDR